MMCLRDGASCIGGRCAYCFLIYNLLPPPLIFSLFSFQWTLYHTLGLNIFLQVVLANHFCVFVCLQNYFRSLFAAKIALEHLVYITVRGRP